jgi:hypothetical protein
MRRTTPSVTQRYLIYASQVLLFTTRLQIAFGFVFCHRKHFAELSSSPFPFPISLLVTLSRMRSGVQQGFRNSKPHFPLRCSSERSIWGFVVYIHRQCRNGQRGQDQERDRGQYS